jgi:hypothetical protein
MNITVNGLTINETCDGSANLEDVLVRLSRIELSENHLVGVVKVNGEEFSESYPGQAKEIGVEEIRELEITTVSLEKLVSAAIKDCTVFLERIVESVQKTAELFRMSDEAEANEYFAKVLESIRALLKFIDTTRNTINWDSHTPVYNGQPIQKEWESLLELVSEMQVTQEEGDWILLADMLEYELAPVLSRWMGIFKGKAENDKIS